MSALIATVTTGSDLSVWEELGEVVVVGSVAGIGLAIAFAFLIRSVVQAGAARRENQTGTFAVQALIATLAGAVCIAAVIGALVSMLAG